MKETVKTLRALVLRWRARADELSKRIEARPDARNFAECAKELESMLDVIEDSALPVDVDGNPLIVGCTYWEFDEVFAPIVIAEGGELFWTLYEPGCGGPSLLKDIQGTPSWYKTHHADGEVANLGTFCYLETDSRGGCFECTARTPAEAREKCECYNE